MAPDLSQELIDHIVDYLYNDKKTLAIACTVARNWVPPCRFHLFRSLRVRHPAGTSHEDFASFLTDSPATAVNVRRLSIEGDMDNTTFPKILTHLPNLRALFLRDWYSTLNPASPPARNAFKLDYVLLDIGFQQDSFTEGYSKLLFKHFGGYCTDGEEGQRSGDDEEIDSDGDENGADEGDVGDVEDGEGGVDRLSDFEGGTDESWSVDHDPYEVSADFDWEDLIDEGPGTDYNSEDDIRHSTYPDAARMVNILSFFSEIKELTIDCPHLRFGRRWKVPFAQLLDLIPETRSPVVHSLSLSDAVISESIFAIFYRLLPLSALESAVYPTFPDLRSIMQEASNLSKLTLFMGEYCEAFLNTNSLTLLKPR